MELPKEYEAIVDAGILHHAEHGVTMDAIRAAVERCFALRSKPKKELTDAEIDVLWRTQYESVNTFARKVIAADRAKQREPETVTFRAAKYKHGPDIQVLRYPNSLNCDWEWLEPAQTFDVVLP